MLNRKQGWLLLGGLCWALSSQAQVNPKEKFASALKAIQANYVDSTDEEAMTDAAILGMIKELDPHSHYMSRREAEAMTQFMSGNYAGVGIQYLMQRDSLFITQIIADGPAEKAGMRPGDRIITIDGQPVNGLDNLAVMKKIRGEKGQSVALTLVRRGLPTPLAVTLVRGRIPDRSVRTAYMVDKETGFISLSIFNQNTRREMDDALMQLKEQGMKNLILDLQGNGGGYVEAAIGVADEFLPKEKLVFYSVGQDKGKDYYYTGGRGQFMSGRLVVLIDQATASSSEILSGSLQDWDRAVLVGRRSFGKGLMQKPVQLLDGSVLELTGARYYTPAGRSIQKPYKGNQYQDDVTTRLKSGELAGTYHLKMADSLRFTTLVSKRTVYGGGGITPDVFVPIDTMELSPVLQQLIGSGIINQEAFAYTDRHRADLKKTYPDFAAFDSRFRIPQPLTASVLKNRLSASTSTTHRQRLTDLVNLNLKAQIASQLFESNTYYLRVLNGDNPSFRQALRVLNTPGLYEQYLQQPAKP